MPPKLPAGSGTGVPSPAVATRGAAASIPAYPYVFDLAELREVDVDVDLNLLTPGEVDRTRRLRTTRLRAEYAASRAALRRMLADHTGVAAKDLVFTHLPCPTCSERHGRPALAEPNGEMHFSLSRTAGVALVKLAPRPIGVDIESVSALEAADDVVPLLHPGSETRSPPPLRRIEPDTFCACGSGRRRC